MAEVLKLDLFDRIANAPIHVPTVEEEASPSPEELDRRATAREEASREGPMPLFRPLSPPSEYPVTALGPVLGPAAKAVAAMAQCALAVAANSVLAVASLAAQGRANAILPIGLGKPSPLSLYMVTVIESGERKSTADSFALKPVRDYERELVEAAAEEKLAHAARTGAYETASKEIHRKHKGDRQALETALRELGPVPQPPLMPIIAPGGDQTFEGLAKIFQHGRPALAMLADDGATVLGGHSLKPENKAGTVGNLCRLWDGSALERIRSLDGATILYDRRQAIHLMIQPGVAGAFLGDPLFADQGLLARFLMAAPTPLADTVTARLRSEDAAVEYAAALQAREDLAPYNRAIDRLLRAPIRWRDENNRAAGVELDSLPLNDMARTLFIQCHNSTMTAMGAGGTLASIRPFANKMGEQAVRIAGILTLIANDRATGIDALTLADAIELAQFYTDEALRLTDAAATDPAMQRAETLRRWLQARESNTIGLQTVYQTGWPQSIRTARAAREAMQVLEDHGWLRRLPDGADIDGKHHKEAWRIVREERP